MLEGYRGKLASLLVSKGIDIGDKIRVRKGNLEVEGILFPSFSKYDDILVIKMDNGYNIGLKIDGDEIYLVCKKSVAENKETKGGEKSRGEVKIISTGGTIVSKIEYETGAVKPALTTEDIFGIPSSNKGNSGHRR